MIYSEYYFYIKADRTPGGPNYFIIENPKDYYRQLNTFKCLVNGIERYFEVLSNGNIGILNIKKDDDIEIFRIYNTLNADDIDPKITLSDNEINSAVYASLRSALHRLYNIHESKLTERTALPLSEQKLAHLLSQDKYYFGTFFHNTSAYSNVFVNLSNILIKSLIADQVYLNKISQADIYPDVMFKTDGMAFVFIPKDRDNAKFWGVSPSTSDSVVFSKVEEYPRHNLYVAQRPTDGGKFIKGNNVKVAVPFIDEPLLPHADIYQNATTFLDSDEGPFYRLDDNNSIKIPSDSLIAELTPPTLKTVTFAVHRPTRLMTYSKVAPVNEPSIVNIFHDYYSSFVRLLSPGKSVDGAISGNYPVMSVDFGVSTLDQVLKKFPYLYDIYLSPFRNSQWTPFNVLIASRGNSTERVFAYLKTLKQENGFWKGDVTFRRKGVSVTQELKINLNDGLISFTQGADDSYFGYRAFFRTASGSVIQCVEGKVNPLLRPDSHLERFEFLVSIDDDRLREYYNLNPGNRTFIYFINQYQQEYKHPANYYVNSIYEGRGDNDYIDRKPLLKKRNYVSFMALFNTSSGNPPYKGTMVINCLRSDVIEGVDIKAEGLGLRGVDPDLVREVYVESSDGRKQRWVYDRHERLDFNGLSGFKLPFDFTGHNSFKLKGIVGYE